ncbi:hypothetical protein M885DRAFT_617221 [Pelagophyceae sp. CCMP2097]|nr:hypothetical protein M885DRAFT_617221 [Pelagophyceae sp. CCMP2097]|mmetsp:Transcript_14676/g.49224  ORF Transcript_14676/g.49224 Transcript_14676/m.49224 type:complete len:329 (-) Transcript_14676:25-1011(-)
MASLDEAIRLVRRQNAELETFANLDDRSFVAGTTFGLGLMAGRTFDDSAGRTFEDTAGRFVDAAGRAFDDTARAPDDRRYEAGYDEDRAYRRDADDGDHVAYTSSTVLNYELEATVDALREDRLRQARERASDAAGARQREARLRELLDASERERHLLASSLREASSEVAQYRDVDRRKTQLVATWQANCLTLQAELITLRVALDDAEEQARRAARRGRDELNDLPPPPQHQPAPPPGPPLAPEQAAPPPAPTVGAFTDAVYPPKMQNVRRKKKAAPKKARAACAATQTPCETALRRARAGGLYTLRGYVPQDPAPRLPARERAHARP